MDYALTMPANRIYGDGDTLSALTDVRDIGLYVARIITDPRTLNKSVLAHTEEKSQNQLFEIVKRLTGEEPKREKVFLTTLR